MSAASRVRRMVLAVVSMRSLGTRERGKGALPKRRMDVSALMHGLGPGGGAIG